MKEIVKDCFSCKHKDEDDDGLLCDHPTHQCGSIIFSAFIHNGHEPNCADMDTDFPVGWEGKK